MLGKVESHSTKITLAWIMFKRKLSEKCINQLVHSQLEEKLRIPSLSNINHAENFCSNVVLLLSRIGLDTGKRIVNVTVIRSHAFRGHSYINFDAHSWCCEMWMGPNHKWLQIGQYMCYRYRPKIVVSVDLYQPLGTSPLEILHCTSFHNDTLRYAVLKFYSRK